MSSFCNSPDERGLFGEFGGQYVAETLMPLILELGREYEKAKDDPAFKKSWLIFNAIMSAALARCILLSA